MAADGSVKVPGVEYFESELLPGRAMFRCSRMSASLQVSSCVGMWKEANASLNTPERGAQCRGCPVGAQHAGLVDPTGHWLRGMPACSRCHRTDLRLIGGNVCVGCKNREYEWVKGRNAKGKFPTCHPNLEPRRVTYRAGGRVCTLVRERTASTTELVVELLRDSPSRVVFGFGRGVAHAA